MPCLAVALLAAAITDRPAITRQGPRLSLLAAKPRIEDASPAVVAPPPEIDVGNKLQTYAICIGIVASWIAVATLVFSRSEGWSLPQSLF